MWKYLVIVMSIIAVTPLGKPASYHSNKYKDQELELLKVSHGNESMIKE